MVVPGARAEARFANNPLVTGAPFIRFYSGAPLATPAGFNIGTLCIFDPTPRLQGFSALERRHLAMLAGMVMAVVPIVAAIAIFLFLPDINI